MPISEYLPIVNLTPVILKTFCSIYLRWEWKGNLIFRWVWKFCWDLSNIISGGNWLFRWDCFLVGLCTPLRSMADVFFCNLLENHLLSEKKIFVTRYSFFNRFTQTPHPLKWPKSTKRDVAKVSCWCSLIKVGGL